MRAPRWPGMSERCQKYAAFNQAVLTLSVSLTYRYLSAFLTHHVIDRTFMFSTLSSRMCPVTQSWRAPRQCRHLVCISRGLSFHLSGSAQSGLWLVRCGTCPFEGVALLHGARIRRWQGQLPDFVHCYHDDSLLKYCATARLPLFHVSAICHMFMEGLLCVYFFFNLRRWRYQRSVCVRTKLGRRHKTKI